MAELNSCARDVTASGHSAHCGRCMSGPMWQLGHRDVKSASRMSRVSNSAGLGLSVEACSHLPCYAVGVVQLCQE